MQDLTPRCVRGFLAANEQLAQQLAELDKRLSQKLSTHDQAIAGILNTLRALMESPEGAVKKRPIGFVVPDEAPWGAYAKSHAPVARVGVTGNSPSVHAPTMVDDASRIRLALLNVAMQDLTP